MSETGPKHENLYTHIYSCNKMGPAQELFTKLIQIELYVFIVLKVFVRIKFRSYFEPIDTKVKYSKLECRKLAVDKIK